MSTVTDNAVANVVVVGKLRTVKDNAVFKLGGVADYGIVANENASSDESTG